MTKYKCECSNAQINSVGHSQNSQSLTVTYFEIVNFKAAINCQQSLGSIAIGHTNEIFSVITESF